MIQVCPGVWQDDRTGRFVVFVEICPQTFAACYFPTLRQANDMARNGQLCRVMDSITFWDLVLTGRPHAGPVPGPIPNYPRPGRRMQPVGV